MYKLGQELISSWLGIAKSNNPLCSLVTSHPPTLHWLAAGHKTTPFEFRDPYEMTAPGSGAVVFEVPNKDATARTRLTKHLKFVTYSNCNHISKLIAHRAL